MKAYMINKTDRAIQNLVNLYFTGSKEKALTEAIGLSILNPNSAEVLNIMASATFKRGRITNCLKFYDRALKIQPNLAEAHNNMGFVVRAGRLELPLPKETRFCLPTTTFAALSCNKVNKSGLWSGLSHHLTSTKEA